jgi:Ca-activated chloride channel family protein
MGTLSTVLAALLRTVAEWRELDVASLRFDQTTVASTALVLLLAVAGVGLLLRSGRAPRTARVSLPALLPSMHGSAWSQVRHAPLLIFLAGVPFFALALADPYTALTHTEASYPGRRIAVMIDASTSMNQPFLAAQLNARGGETYFATVAAAEYFMKLRMEGQHRDLIALIEFGNEAYVVTPFTTDYQNVLLSMRLIAARDEWERFPDQGTIIIQAIKQATRLFSAFDFLNASGNLMVIFSDGQDTQTLLNGQSIDSIMADALRHKIPVYFIRMAYDKASGGLLPDEIWKAAVERTGGRFYAAANEATILEAVHEIDRLAPGRIDVREYETRRPHFAGPLVTAVALWLVAAVLKLTVPKLRSFP